MSIKDNHIYQIFIIFIFIMVFGCSSMQSIREGDLLATQDRWDEALTIYNAALEESPGNTEYRIKVEKAKYEAALIHIKKGEELAKEKKYDHAIMEFQYADA